MACGMRFRGAVPGLENSETTKSVFCRDVNVTFGYETDTFFEIFLARAIMASF